MKLWLQTIARLVMYSVFYYFRKTSVSGVWLLVTLAFEKFRLLAPSFYIILVTWRTLALLRNKVHRRNAVFTSSCRVYLVTSLSRWTWQNASQPNPNAKITRHCRNVEIWAVGILRLPSRERHPSSPTTHSWLLIAMSVCSVWTSQLTLLSE